MNYKISLFITILTIFISSSISAFGITSNGILEVADSLFKEGQYPLLREYLQPFEKDFEEESDFNKWHYYWLISSSYRKENDFQSAIPFMEMQAKYNRLDIKDHYNLVDIFTYDYRDYTKAMTYAKKAILLDDEITLTGLEKDYTTAHIGRLHYILGVLSSRSNNKIMAEEHLNWLNNNGCPIDSSLLNHLVESIEEISDNENYNDSIQIENLYLFKNSLKINPHIEKHDNIEKYTATSGAELDSIASLPDLDMKKYLNTVFTIEDRYTESDMYQAMALLKNAIEVSNSNKFFLTPSIELCELKMRLGRGDLFLKQYDSAITWFLLAYIDSRKMKNGFKYNIQALGEIATTYLLMDDKCKSEVYAEEMFEEINKLNIQEGIDDTTLLYLAYYAYIVSNLGYELFAEELYKLIIEYSPKQSQAYRLACNNYATYLSLNNRQEEGCNYYFLIKEAFPTTQTLSNLSMAYLMCNNIPEAQEAFHDYYVENISQLETVLGNFSEPEWSRFWEKYGYEFYITSNFLASKINTKESLVNGYNASVLSKSLPLSYKINIDRLLSSSDDNEIQRLYSQYVASKQILSKGLTNSYKHNITTIDVKILEDSIIRRINISDKELRYLINDYDKVLSSLTNDEVAIEFCEYLDVLSPKDSISLYYAAYIIDPLKPYPNFVIIGDEIEISNYILNSHKDEISLNELYLNNKIGELVWDKIFPHIENKQRIYFTPIGELSLLNHWLIRCSHTTLGEKFDMRRVSSTSLIPDFKKDVYTSQYPTAVLYGDINYDTDYLDMKCAAASYNHKAESTHISLRGDENREGWTNLHFSKQEIDSINVLMQKKGCSSLFFYGNNANEESFKALDFCAPSIIHIASHGFTYFNNDEVEKRNKIMSVSPYTSESIYMSWAGLLFSGANNTWTRNYQIQDFEDGILTANEISLLHLDGAKLVVLSACNTGLGINDTYGSTIGLQKAFKMAGAKSILMSLWKVPDESTALLMTKFYEALFSGHNRHEALKIAMKKTSEIYPDPFYWGAFVILD